MAASSFRGRASEFCHSNSRELKGTFAVAAVAILFGALASQVDNDRRLAGTRTSPDPHLVTIDLDFLASDGSQAGGFYSLGPLGQVDLGRDPSQRFITYTSGPNSVALVAAGTSYSGLDWWKGEAGSRPASVDGVHARYEHFFPSTAADVVAGIDGVEFTLEIRSRPLVGVGELSYDFWLDASPGLIPGQGGRPLLASNAGVATVRGSVPIMDGAGRTVFVVTPATAFVDFNAAPGPATGRSVSAYEAAFPAHEPGERQSVPLDYRLERVGSRTKVSVVLPADLFLDPAIQWPVRVDPGITNPIANSSYFADETILMDSDLVVTSTGAAQFSNVTLIMNRTASPNYNISVSQGGRMTLLSSTVKSNDSALPYKFTINGSFTAQDTMIRHANDGLQLFGNSSTLSNVTLQDGTGRGLVLQGGNASMARVNIPSALSTGLYAQSANLEAQFLNVTGAGGEGLYLNRTSGNVTWSHVLNATLNGAMVVNASRVNITNSEFAGSGRNGILVIGGSPSIENSTITSNNWSGIALFDDHSGYLYGNWIAGNNWSGIETRLNSTADIYANSIEGNAKAGIRVVASDPNIERNTIRGSEIGVWLEGAHNPGAKPGATGGTEDGYSYLMAASSELGDGTRVILIAGVSITHQGPSTQADVPPGTIQFSLLVTNTDNAPPPVPIDLSIDDDELAWASLSQSSLMLGGGQSSTVTLTITVPSDATPGSTYSVLVWANESVPPFPQASVWAYVDLQSATGLQVTSIQTGNQTTVGLSAVLTSGGSPLSGKTVAFKLDGNWIGEATTDQGGMAVLQHTVSQPPLSQVLLAYFNGTQYYEASSGSGYVNITWTATYLEIGNTTGRWGDTTELRARLVATPGGGFVMARKVYFSVNGTLVGTAYTDRLGNASLFLNDTVEPSTVAWNASFDGDPYAGDSSNTSNFTSYKDLTEFEGPSFMIRQGETAAHALNLTDDEGYALGSRTVHVKRGSTTLADVTTNASGYASYADTGAQNLDPGDYSMTYVFDGDDHFYTSTHYLTLTVRRWVTHFNATDQTEYYGDGGTLLARLLDEDGGAVASKSVNVFVGSTQAGSVSTNATGWAVFSDTTVRAARTYVLRFSFAQDTRNAGVNALVNLTVLREVTQFSVIVDARIGTGDVLIILLRLTDDDGVGLSKAVNLTLLGALFANGTTNATGYLNVTFDARGMIPQRYTLWYWFDGDLNYTAAQAYTRIVVEYDADLYGNIIEQNGAGVKANNSSSKLVGNRIAQNGDNVAVTNGSLLIYNSSVGLSTVADYRVGEGGSVFSTNTTFNRGKVAFDSGAVLLHVRWLLNVRMLNPVSGAAVSGVVVVLRNATGDIVLNKTTNATGWFGEEAVTEYTQRSAGKSMRTAHTLSLDGTSLTIVMDVSRNLTLFTGVDSDNDGIANYLEDASDVYWVEAEAHVLEFTQLVDTRLASGGRAVRSLGADLRFVDPSTYPVMAAGSYTLLLRVRGATATGRLRAVVRNETGVALLNVSYTPSGTFRWFQSPAFEVATEQALTINITDESSNVTAAALELDEIVLARMALVNGTVTHRPGQITSPFQADSDFDQALDGAEVRNGTYWLEAENLASTAAGAWRSNWNASNSWEVGHAAGNATAVTLNESLVGLAGVYALWVRARGNGTAGTLRVDRYVDGVLSESDNLSFPASEFGLAAYRFEFVPGQALTITLNDTADTSNGTDVPGTWVDKVGLVLEFSRPYVKAYNPMADPATLPEEGTTLVYVGKESGMGEMIYWVANSTLYSVPFWALYNNGTTVSTWSYEVGAHPTQPAVVTLKDGTRILATSGGDFVYAFRLPIDPNPLKYNITLATGGNPVTINALASLEGWVVGTTTIGKAFGLEVTGTSLQLRWIFDPALSGSHGVGSMFHDKAYFGFDNGLLAINYNLTGPGGEAWRIGPGEWPDPRSRCPPAYTEDCEGYQNLPAVNRSVAGAPLFDMGNLFVVAYNATEVDLYRLSEDGETIWAQKLNTTPPTQALNWTAPQIALRYSTVVVLGTSIEVFDRESGLLMMAHDFNYSWTDNFYASPLFTDRELVAPGPDGIYFFSYPMPQAFGDTFATDGNYTFGAAFAEEIVWRLNETALVNRQPILGDFDNSGYRDLMYANATGFVFVKDFEVGYRTYAEYTQLGRDASHGANAEYLFSYVPTDALDPDTDFDNLTDGAEIGLFFGYAQVEAEDAVDFHAWADSAANGSAKNFNFFHQTGVTLTSDDGNVSFAADQRTSWVRIPVHIGQSGTYKVRLVPNLGVKEIVDLVYAQGNLASPGSVDTSQGYGTGASLDNRSMTPEAEPFNLTSGQVERVRQIFENATYLKVRYASFYGPGDFTSFGTARNAKVTVYSATYDPKTREKMRLVVFVSMDFEMELFGARDYVLEVGLNLSLVPSSGLGGDTLPANLSLIRIVDLDKLRIEKRTLAPFDPDADDDGVLDGDEAGWFPWQSDVDQDGLSDTSEVQVYGTDPGDRDSDHDGIRDRVELGIGQGDTDPYTPYDSTASWASYPEWVATQFRGDPHFRPPTTGRVLPNWDADTSTHTDPNDPDSDDDGVPDGWVDGWVYDASGLAGEVQSAAGANQEYLSRAQPVEYDVKNWRQAGVYDNYAQIWEGEDANLNGAREGNQSSPEPLDHWSFWESTVDPAGGFLSATTLSYIRRGQGESDAANPDTDNDALPEGFEIYYTTRGPVLRDPAVQDSYFYTPITDEGWMDDDAAYLDPPINEMPSASNPTSQLLSLENKNLAEGIKIPDPVVDPAVARLVSLISIYMNGTVNGTSVTLELWASNASNSTPAAPLASARGLSLNVSSWVNFTIEAQWLNFSVNSYYAVLKDASSNVTWWKNDSSASNWAWYKQNETGVWSTPTLTSKHPTIRVYDRFSVVGDGLNNSEEYVLGTNPKLRDTDANTAGPLSRLGDGLDDGNETKDKVIFRTNAKHGAVNHLYYDEDSWILLDPSLETGGMSDWMYFPYLERIANPNETFGGAKNRTAYLYTLSDGSEFRINVSANRLYLYFPGSDFENLLQEENLSNTSQHYNGTAFVFYQANASGISDDYKTNAIIPVSTNKWLFQLKQLCASDPFDWDTDNDGLADGWEIDGLNDTDGDFVPNVRDFDADGDSLTDGQEMLQVKETWKGEPDDTRLDPDGDALYPMVDSDSDGDGIPDAKEVLWSVDTDGDAWINLVDGDSDGDGLCDGWCTNASVADWRTPSTKPAAGGLPNGEDANQNGTNEQGESSPIKVDTDGDRLWDGYSYWSGADRFLDLNGSTCSASPTKTNHCGESSTYLLFNGSSARNTNRTSPDSDRDGLTDFVEVRGWTFDVWLLGLVQVKRWTAADPWKNDTDGDGLSDLIERDVSNATSTDSDDDGLADAIEDANRDGISNATETGVTVQDSDNDGLPDGNMTIDGAVLGEDLNRDGVIQNTETFPRNWDSDGDGLKDAVELNLLHSIFPSATPAHDADGDGYSDLRDRDADNDGLDDNVEDSDQSGSIDTAWELNPYDNDTDNDGLLDGAETDWYFDTNDDGQINGRDNDSNGDLHNDSEQVYTVFRTNATQGAYGAAGVWVALPQLMVNLTASAPSFTASNALYVSAGEVESAKGQPFMVVYKGVPYDENSPDGRMIWFFENGSNDEVYIAAGDGHFAKFTKSSDAPFDYSTSAYPVDTFLAKHQETYFGAKSVDLDSDEDEDHDGIPNIRENGRGMNPYSNDSDGDGVLDLVEQRWSADTDMDGHINALDKDSDNDGVPDGTEDANRDGIRQSNETDVLRQDTDYDSLQDGTELGFTTGTSDTCTSSGQSGCSQAWIAKLDAQGWTVTSPLDVDSDDDGIKDGLEDSDHNGRYDNGSETNATNPDTDGDLLWDGIETGVMVPTEGTNLALWHRDGSPFENTNPRSPDTDGDHLMDSVEDWNLDGLQTWGTNETDPGLYDSDGDGLCDGNCSGKGEDLNLNGWRDQDEEGNWTETDALANDSDVDGILDGLEVNGTYCFSNQSSGCSHPALDPLNADSDGDQLRDGQETAGWRVLVWREITMEKLDNRTVVPLPWVQDTDGDGNSDFVEFQNGSDPWSPDTDGDTFPDHSETINGFSPTGFAEAPPTISNWHLGKENRGGNLIGYGKSTVAVVSFDVVALWGVGNWWVRYGLPQLNASQQAEIQSLTGLSGQTAALVCAGGGMLSAVVSDEKCQRLYEIFGNSRVGPKEISGYGGGLKEIHVSVEFTMTWEEDLKDGVWIQAQVDDVYGLGTQKTLKLKSLLEVVVDFLASVAKAIAEAASAFVRMLVAKFQALMDSTVQFILQGFNQLSASAQRELNVMTTSGPIEGSDDERAVGIINLLFGASFLGPVGDLLLALAYATLAIDLMVILLGVTPFGLLLLIAVSIMIDAIVILIFSAAQSWTQDIILSHVKGVGVLENLLLAIVKLALAGESKDSVPAGGKNYGPRIRSWKKWVLPIAALGVFLAALSAVVSQCWQRTILVVGSWMAVGLAAFNFARNSEWMTPIMKKTSLVSVGGSIALASISTLRVGLACW